MNKNIKTVFLLFIIIAIFISVMSVIYGVVNLNKNSTNISDDEYNAITEESIDKCKGYVSSLTEDSDINEYNEVIAYYVENIEKETSPQLKLYVSYNMLTYALNYFSQKSVEFEAHLPSEGAVSPFNSIISELNDMQTRAKNLL